MKLIERIDIAIQQARTSRPQLAEAIDVTTQAISNLKRRPGSTLRPENVAKAARFLKCDLYWLCTGDGPYEPERSTSHTFSFLAAEVASWLDALPEDERNRAFARIYQLCKDSHFPTGLANHAETEHRTRGSLVG